MKKWSMKDTIREVEKSKYLHFANPEKGKIFRKMEVLPPKVFQKFARLMLGIPYDK